MSDARDQINLAAWMERRMDAIGPYGPHILDGVKRYEARIAHHDDVVQELVEAAWRAGRDAAASVVAEGWAENRYQEEIDEALNALAPPAALAKIAQEGQR